MNKIEILRKRRDLVVQKWDAEMEPLREARRNEEQIDWNLWDELTRQMQIKTAQIDFQILQEGGEV